MKTIVSWLGTTILGIITVIVVLVAFVICPPIKTSYAGHGGGNAGYAAGGALAGMMVGACMADQMARDRAPTTVIISGHQHGQGCGHTYYNRIWFPDAQCSYYEDTGEVYQCQ